MGQLDELEKLSKYIKEENFDKSIFTPVNNFSTDRHTVYSFENAGEKYVIKLFNREEKFQNEVQGYEFATKKNVKTYKMLENASTGKGTKYIIMNFLPGVNGERVINTGDFNSVLYQMGENIGLLHTNSIEGTPGHGDRLAKKTVVLKEIIREDGIGNEAERKFLLNACDECEKMIGNLSFDDVRFGYGHGDFGLQNVAVEDGILTGIFDFEMSGYTNTELDLIQVYRKHLYANDEAEKAFFDGYCKHMTIAEGFEKRKYAYMLLESLVNCSWSFNKKHEYFEENIRFIQEILG